MTRKYPIFAVYGHRTLDDAEFKEHYIPMLELALRKGAHFLIQDNPVGLDKMAQEYLAKWPGRVTVYHKHEKPRFCMPGFKAHGGYRSEKARKFSLIEHSDGCIAWQRPVKEQHQFTQERSDVFSMMEHRKVVIEKRKAKRQERQK